MANIEEEKQENPEPKQIGHSSMSPGRYEENTEEDSANESQNSLPQCSNQGLSSDQDAVAHHSRLFKTNENDTKTVDCVNLDASCVQKDKERWAKLLPMVKNFYIEDPEVSEMSPSQVEEWRSENSIVQVLRTNEEQVDLKPIPNPVLTFEQAFKNYPEILDALYKQDLKKPSPIQSQAWPILLGGGDLIGISQTGTGKTLAFLLPALIHIEGQIIPKEKRQGPPVLILEPTRELVIQISKEVSKYTNKNIKTICLYGGIQNKEDIYDFLKGVDIVVATPGSLRKYIVANYLHSMFFSYIVFDEADKLLGVDYGEDVQESLLGLRPGHQTVMTAVTWPDHVASQVNNYMTDAIHINAGPLHLTAVPTITQQLIFVEIRHRETILLNFITNMKPTDKVIVFCNSKPTVLRLTSELCINGIYCESLYGDRDYHDRKVAMEQILNGSATILIATNVASRGIHIEGLTHVINFDFPRSMVDYIFRIGRTGRGGKTGTAISYVARYDWRHTKKLIRIMNEANQEIPRELIMVADRYNQITAQYQGQRDNDNNREIEFLNFYD
ncbi:PREDICTED: probable ATP-dependent RNA helicase DDX53 [Papilio xuthus]|uniref:RNA helicase n=1 Tax=Papilio xuthus TaxID=66420 RepID=A0AAJ6ZV51_PAPXU|nr:PREDICTED: probable ATP-dependent RNA helicase DDX53 [Papilio xuthus]